jgi:hypothetical protein
VQGVSDRLKTIEDAKTAVDGIITKAETYNNAADVVSDDDIC